MSETTRREFLIRSAKIAGGGLLGTMGGGGLLSMLGRAGEGSDIQSKVENFRESLLKIKKTEKQYGDKNLDEIERINPGFLKAHLKTLSVFFSRLLGSRLSAEELVNSVQFIPTQDILTDYKPGFPKKGVIVSPGHRDFISPRSTFPGKKETVSSLGAFRSELFSRFLMIEAQPKALDPELQKILNDVTQSKVAYHTQGFSLYGEGSWRNGLMYIDWAVRQLIIAGVGEATCLEHTLKNETESTELLPAILATALSKKEFSWITLLSLYRKSDLKGFTEIIDKTELRVIGQNPLLEESRLKQSLISLLFLDLYTKDNKLQEELEKLGRDKGSSKMKTVFDVGLPINTEQINTI